MSISQYFLGKTLTVEPSRLKTRHITPKFGRLADVTTVAIIDVCHDSVPADLWWSSCHVAPSSMLHQFAHIKLLLLSSTIRLIVHKELCRHASVPVQARDTHCRIPSTTINAASFDERSYSNRRPRLRAPLPMASNIEPAYVTRDSYSDTSQPSSFVPEREQCAQYTHNTATLGMPRESPVCYL